MCILCLRNDFWMCHAILGSTFRNKTTSKIRPLTTVPRVVIFVRFYCTYKHTYIRSLSCGLYSQCTSFPVICHFRRKEIPQDFPAEHPYSSHREKFRVFPDTRREEDVLSSDKEIVEVPLCKVIDRAQFKGWRREEVGYYRPFSARNRAEDEERLRLATRALTTKHKVYLCVLCLCMMHCTQVRTYMCVQ